MAGDRWQHVQVLFEQALTRPASEREAFVAEACGEDPELRAEVASLLACDGQAPPEFLRPPEPDSRAACADARTSDEDDPLIGTHISHYLIKRVIASGGMGTVYEALQDRPERPVALKVLRAGVYTKSALRRFEFESEILAHLRHPNIAQVYEAGTAELGTEKGFSVQQSVPYFAMEYVPDATPLTGYAERHGLSTQERLELFAQVCEAVHHGHQKGIVHRDLKPGNLLVDSSGDVKIIDFGVARATDSDVAVTTVRTDVGQLIGTLQYMSPEQCDADPHGLDMRSDVYSLGVVAYELLTGQPPYDASGTTIYQATRIIKEQVPQRLSEINRKLRGDVETIVLKALEKEREQRYQSAADLARDVRHYLNREPIEAKPPTAWTRAVRWVVRHPVAAAGTLSGVSSAAIVVLATLIGVSQFNARPHRIRLSDDGREARLLSFLGGVLHTWTADIDRGIVNAKLVERPEELGGGRLALVGFATRYHNSCPRSLCAFDADGDLNEPLWRGRVESDEPLPDPHDRGYVAEEFSLKMFRVFDVFPERPGDEIVAVHNHHTYSQCFIRVYDLTGSVLYQVWYDGDLPQCECLSKAHLLVFAGDNAEVYAEDRGIVGVRRPHPYVLFAIRAQVGQVLSAFLETGPGTGALSPVWFRRLQPDNSRDLVDQWLIGAEGPAVGVRGRALRVTAIVDEEAPAGVAWDVDEFGNEIPGSRGWGDSYKRNLRQYPVGHPQRLPHPDVFKLGELPPIVSTLGNEAVPTTAERSSP